ncbi:MAG TPA: precorrin-6A reductase [Syntrophomonadaceae bacterium]|nr:precorrin-6A reductase [Syntrophomonadaceae bacterium]
MILLLAGTKDGRELAADLVSAGFRVLASVTTPYGGALLREIPGVIVKIGRLDAAEMQRLVDRHRIKGILDATHPFAAEISQVAENVARSSGRPYLRWERQSAALPESSLLYQVQDWDGVAEKISDLHARSIFLAVGVNNLAFIVGHPLLSHCSFAVRVLPLPGAVSTCLRVGLKPQQIVALQGPGSRELNRTLFEHFQVDALVTKESGPEGGTAEKVRAALDLGIPIVLVERPVSERTDYGHVVSDKDAVIRWAEQVEYQSTDFFVKQEGIR